MIAIRTAIEHVQAAQQFTRPDEKERRLGDRAMEDFCKLLQEHDEAMKELMELRKKLKSITDAFRIINNES